MSKRIIITGATGFIGSAIVREFLNSGDEVIVLTRANSNLSRLESVSHSLQLVIYDSLVEKNLIKSMMANRADVLVHCAWRGVAGGERNEAFQIYENIPTTIQSVELAAKLGCHQWIGLGSQAEYGNLNCKISESSEILPTTLYGKAKLSAGIAALGLCEAYEMKGSWLRVFSTYGPGDAANWFIPYVIQEFLAGRAPKLTKCEQLWDYLHVEDAARAVIAVAQAKASGVFNLGSGSTHPLKTYIETIREILRTDLIPEYGAIPYRPDQVMHLEADINRLIEQTGWRPSVSLFSGLTQTVVFEKTRLIN
jgi:UDP-glucose 4-epimerase